MLLVIVGCLLVAAAFHAPLQLAAVAAGLFSMLSFVAVAYVVGDFNAELYRVVIVDLVASLLSIGAGVIIFWWDSGGTAA